MAEAGAGSPGAGAGADAGARPAYGAHRVRLGTLLSLVAGRSSFRLAQLGANVALLPLWGQQRYGVFAGALATFSWVIPLLQAGPEKTVLKLRPRAPRTGPQISEAIVALLWLLPLPVLAAFALAVAAGERGLVAIYLGVAAMSVGSGSTLLLAGLHRAAGRAHYDFRAAFTLAVVQLLLIGAVLAGLPPLGYVASIVAAQTVVNAVLLAGLGRPTLRILGRPGFLRRVLWTVVWMGSPEICLYLCTSVLFAMLAASGWSAQVGPLFAVLLVWSAAVAFVLYGLRIYAPQTSVRLHGRAGTAGRARGARIARLVVAIDAAWAGLFVAVVAATGLLDATRHGQHLLLWALVLASRTPAVVALLIAGFLIENSDARSTRITGVAAVAGLATATAAGALLVFAYGGLGLLASGAIAEAVQALVIVTLVRRHGVASITVAEVSVTSA